eukprot:7882285-Pyramimonas_sp.AAC.1
MQRHAQQQLPSFLAGADPRAPTGDVGLHFQLPRLTAQRHHLITLPAASAPSPAHADTNLAADDLVLPGSEWEEVNHPLSPATTDISRKRSPNAVADDHGPHPSR